MSKYYKGLDSEELKYLSKQKPLSPDWWYLLGQFHYVKINKPMYPKNQHYVEGYYYCHEDDNSLIEWEVH